MSDERACGGCNGLGAHSRRCHTQPGFLWRIFEDKAEELGDLIGSNDPEAANTAYALAARMRAKAADRAAAVVRVGEEPQ
jgi:hypothetical protein